MGGLNNICVLVYIQEQALLIPWKTYVITSFVRICVTSLSLFEAILAQCVIVSSLPSV